ncbi:hypothetical protein TI39_contig4309g00010 [Zymoseptoria brevis]|uniref:Suppressor of anucleate metulae protein B n=1 Tax=Zymoseptoria brevis TaxID=1047168 RepID=A0A0F4G7X6_9PEZI|nr:hypothetical protein TI39_contig4309g00010 [Zymoseptoria brevis]
MPPDTALGLCAECKKPAQIECTECSEGVDMHGRLSPVGYCGVDCQEEHNFEHLYVCKEKNDRKAIYRAGHILREALLESIESTRVSRGIALPRVEQRDGKVHLYTDERKASRTKFSKLSMDNDARLLEELAITFRNSGCAMTMMADLSQKLLQGVTTSLRELVVELPAAHSLVVLHQDVLKVDEQVGHQVLVAKGTDGVEYIIDLTGEEFGGWRPVMPYEVYKNRHPHTSSVRRPHGNQLKLQQKALADGLKDVEEDGTYDPQIQQAIFEWESMEAATTAQLKAIVCKWEIDNNTTVGKLVQQPEREYQARKASLLARITKDIRSYLASQENEDASLKSLQHTNDSCAACGQSSPRPLLVCTDCADGVGDDGTPTPTVYCDKVCRKANSRDHTKLCSTKNDRKELYRAGEILQAAFYIWRETAFDVKAAQISKATRKPRKDYLVLQEGDYDVKPHGPLYTLPKVEHLNNNEKNAVLTCSACTDAMIYLHSLSEKLLAGIVEEVWETDARVTDSDYSILRVSSTFEPIDYSAKHQFLTVEAAADGKRYQARWMTRNTKRLDHGSAAAQAVKLRSGERYVPPEADVSVHHVHAAREKVLEQTVDEWEQAHEQSANEMLRADQKTYDADRTSFLDAIRAALKQWSADYDSGVVKVEIPKHHQRAIHQSPANDGVDQSDVVGTPAFFAKLKALNMNVHYC